MKIMKRLKGKKMKTENRSTKRCRNIVERISPERIREWAVSLYMAAVFVLLPLLLKDKYSMLGTFKYELFRFLSFAGLGIVFLTEVSVLAAKLVGGKKADSFRKHLSVTDWFVAGYGICVTISFLLAVDKAEALWGAKGWYMGFVSQLIFVISYFVVSRWWSGKLGVWYAACIAAFCCIFFRCAASVFGRPVWAL